MLAQLAEVAINIMQVVLSNAAALSEAAETLESLRVAATDAAPPDGFEEQKREALTLWSDQAKALKVCVDMIERGPASDKEVSEELLDMLRRGYRAYFKQDIPKEMEEFFMERSNNIAAAYMGRVAREPK